MILLAIAHRGEAQSLLKGLKMKAHSEMPELYLNSDLALVLTGEGIYDTTIKLTRAIMLISPSKVINLGIAGSLKKGMELGSIWPIRTIYAYSEVGPRFQSFTSERLPDTKTKFDCITTDFRVLSDKAANKLSPFAQIVDRELWAIGKVSKEFQVPFQSYKLISDHAGAATECFDLKERAKEFSDQLLTYFQTEIYTKIKDKDKDKDKDNNTQDERPIEKEYSFHTSFTLKKRIQKLSKKLNISTSEINEIAANSKSLSRKELPHFIIEVLEEKISPIDKKAKEHIQNALTPLEMIGAKVYYDSKLESQKITLQMEINSQKNIENLTEVLSRFEYSKIQKVFEGKFDV